MNLVRALFLSFILACSATWGQQAFTPQDNTVTISATTSSSTPVQVTNRSGYASGYTVTNTGTVGVFIAASTNPNIVAAVPVSGTPANGFYVAGGQTVSLQLAPNAWFAAITGSNTATVYVTPGTGQLTGAGGGGSGGATTLASGAVASGAYASGSIASGAMVDLGAQADSSCGTDTGTCTLIALIKRLNSLLDGTSSQLPTALGATNSAGSASFTLATNDKAPVAPATATATSSVIAGATYNSTAPTFTNGQQGGMQVDASGNLKTVLAPPSTGTQTSVASSATDVTVLASNASRKGACVYNDSTQVLYLLLASGTSSTTNYTAQVGSQALFCIRVGEYSGVLKGIWSSANGNARVTEWQ